mmetsp:Transcript_10051/g.18924  ORF Transcript_10051/g.18924 Transcript_10051/m.18924 type:complete len:266 (-) Transcript_10051:247-1044(-)
MVPQDFSTPDNDASQFGARDQPRDILRQPASPPQTAHIGMNTRVKSSHEIPQKFRKEQSSACSSTSGLAFVSPRILNRPVRAPSRKNRESCDEQYQQEMRRLEVKRELASCAHEKRNGSSDALAMPGLPSSEAAINQGRKAPHQDFGGTFDPVKGNWLHHTEDGCSPKDIEARPDDNFSSTHGHYQRARTLHSGSQNPDYNPITGEWTVHVDVNTSGSLGDRDCGKSQGKLRHFPTSTGIYNPITNEWIEPPRDPRFLDREGKGW